MKNDIMFLYEKWYHVLTSYGLKIGNCGHNLVTIVDEKCQVHVFFWSQDFRGKMFVSKQNNKICSVYNNCSFAPFYPGEFPTREVTKNHALKEVYGEITKNNEPDVLLLNHSFKAFICLLILHHFISVNKGSIAKKSFSIVFIILLSIITHSNSYYIYTIAVNGSGRFSGDGDLVTIAQINFPTDAKVSSHGII